MKVFYDKDADLARLEGRTVAILGYGSQGHAHALNLRDSGVDVVVGLREGSDSRPKAAAEDLPVLSIADAAAAGDVVMMALPDETMGDIYAADIEPNLKPGKYLVRARDLLSGAEIWGPEQEVEVTAGQTATLEVLLPRR